MTLLKIQDIPFIEIVLVLVWALLAAGFLCLLFFWRKVFRGCRYIFLCIPRRIGFLIKLRTHSRGHKISFLRFPLASVFNKSLYPDFTAECGAEKYSVSVLSPTHKKAALNISDHGDVELSCTVRKFMRRGRFLSGLDSFTEHKSIATYKTKLPTERPTPSSANTENAEPVKLRTGEDYIAAGYTPILLIHPVTAEVYGVTKGGRELLFDGSELKNGYTVYSLSGFLKMLTKYNQPSGMPQDGETKK